MTVQQESQCAHFQPSCVAKNEICFWFNFGRCNSKGAKEEATKKMVAAVKRNLREEHLDQIIDFVRKNP
jgi:hypothetical protein